MGCCALLAAGVGDLQTLAATHGIPSADRLVGQRAGWFIGALLAVPLGFNDLSGSALRRQFDVWFGLFGRGAALHLSCSVGANLPPKRMAWDGGMATTHRRSKLGNLSHEPDVT